MNTHASTSVKLRGCFRRTLPGCGLLVFLGAVLMTGLIAWIFGIPSGVDSGYHPFRSRGAEIRFKSVYDDMAQDWPVPAEERLLQSQFGDTFVRISGPVGARGLVLLHGVGGNSLQWTSSVEMLSETRRVYALDVITEHGRSVYRVPFRSADDYINWLDDTLDQLGLEDPVDFIGMSYGGWMTARYALTRPERVGRAVLIAPAGTVLPLSTQWIKRAVMCVIPDPGYTREFMQWLMADTWNGGETGKKIVNRWADFSYLCIRSFKPKTTVNPDVLSGEEWARITVPMLFMVGRNEKIYDPARAVARLNGLAPDIQTVIVEGAGHDLLLVKPAETTATIMDFLEGRQPVQANVR